MGIHGYDKYMWTVRSGYLTLVFGAWGVFVKAAVESENISLVPVLLYIIVLAIMMIVLPMIWALTALIYLLFIF